MSWLEKLRNRPNKIFVSEPKQKEQPVVKVVKPAVAEQDPSLPTGFYQNTTTRFMENYLREKGEDFLKAPPSDWYPADASRIRFLVGIIFPTITPPDGEVLVEEILTEFSKIVDRMTKTKGAIVTIPDFVRFPEVAPRVACNEKGDFYYLVFNNWVPATELAPLAKKYQF